MRIATWNLRHGRPHHGFASNRRLTEAAAGLAADVLGVQEVERRVVRSWFADQPARIARATKAIDYVYAPARRLVLIGSDGVALFVRGRIVRHQIVSLGYRRVVLLAVADVGGQRLSIACTHLQNEAAAARDQLRMVIEAFEPWPRPRLLLGDLNLSPADVNGPLEAAGFTVAGGGFSEPAWEPRQRIDHVAVDGLPMTGEVVVPPVPVSDHRPVITEVG